MLFNDLTYFDRFLKLKPHIMQAGDEIIRMRNDSSFKVMIKPDNSPVSNADIWANGFFTDLIQQLYPDETIIGEESEDKNYAAGTEKLWFIDPIDGTKNYVRGNDHFFILIGYCVDGIPDFGIYYKPLTQEFVVGSSLDGVFYINKNKDPLPLVPTEWPLKNASIIMKRVEDDLKTKLRTELNIHRHPYIFDKVEMLGPLFGQSNGYLSMRKTAYWDLCAPAAIIRAGGYELAHNPDNDPVLFNDGQYQMDFYYSLPKNAPSDIKKLLFQYQL